MVKLNPCPFCGGKGKISFRDVKFMGQNYRGDKKIKCAAQVICNRCRARGPVYTSVLINPYDFNCQVSEPYIWMVEKAVYGWNAARPLLKGEKSNDEGAV